MYNNLEIGIIIACATLVIFAYVYLRITNAVQGFINWKYLCDLFR